MLALANTQKVLGSILSTGLLRPDKSRLATVQRGSSSQEVIVVLLVCIIGRLGLQYGAMCLAVPVKIVSIDGDEAETEIAGVRRRASIALTPEARVGDYVLLHTGYAIGVVDEVEAEETLKLLEEIASLSEVH
jgi:hydrogenase expression/formation protein HypC